MEILVLPPTENIQAIIKNLPVKLTTAYYYSLQFQLKNNNTQILLNGRDIKEFSFVWLSSSWNTRDLATAVKIYLEESSTPHSFVEQNTSKITDSMTFVLNDIPYPNTYFVESMKTMDHLKQIEKTCGYPLIMKDSKGFGGNDMSYISCEEELKKVISKNHQNKKYIFQQYIPNNYDWGVLVSNNRIVSAERSYPKPGEFRNNCSAGATEIFDDIKNIPAGVKAIALKASTLLGLQWSRSDIIIDKISNKPYLLEVNRFPGITLDSTEVVGANSFLRSCLAEIG